ncbi:cytochrome c oxidase subunit 3 [Hirschia baltica]|uniref:cytochrome-c oxidase n=1 Tax=Hirschia baltica (strain ATCC 49814 / DSM 5838 / IFAM 1418) TaxID=582402 RepID=C6XR90_HIRBI|nr:cytochrome c oxidase subunit 3 [Hirschia baltica]ACT58722.1 Cytochrome-c oxidase [Hirschia baltica ATCC 49814]
MAHGATKHDYHIVDPSPWPVLASLGLFVLALGGVAFMKGLLGIPEGNILTIVPGLLIITVVLIGWWADTIKESRAGDHTPVVQMSLKYGMILFIASEVMFFVGWFWSFFEMVIFHEHRATGMDVAQFENLAAWANWPVMQNDGHQVQTFDPFHLPLINTLILLLSGTTVTWAHHALQEADYKGAKLGLFLTVILGAFFTFLQVIEYQHAGFSFDGSLYGSAFYMATGFHGAHVVIGTLFLAVCLFRLLANNMTAEKHLGFEFAAWYWHFVDVVWLFLFAFVYVAPHIVLGGGGGHH